MANSKISALTSATTPLAGTEVLPIVQSSTTKQVATNDLTVRNIRANATTGILQVTGPTAGTTRVATVPDANWTAARTDAGQTFSGLQNFSFTGGNGPVVNRTDGSGYINFQSAGTNNAQIGEDGAAGFTIYTNLAVSAKQTMTWRSDGDVRLPVGNLIPTTAAKGINFTANTPAAGMTSQLLNWYEEGTWTPIDASGASLTFTVNNANYTRIGREVNARFDLTYPTTADVSGASIGGFPFGNNASTGICSGFIGYNSSTVSISIFMGAGTAISLVLNPSGGSVTNANLSGKRIIATMVYFA